MGITKEHLERIEKQAKVMESFANASVDVSSELDAIVQDNYQMERQIEFLLETNDRLRKQLDSDAYMKLPLDADGKPIRIGDVVNVDGDAMTVLGYRLHNDMLLLVAKDKKSGLVVTPEPSRVRHFKPVQPDSWDKLEKDAMRRVCELAGSGHLRCGDCEWGKEGIGCQAMARLEILKRAKKLAGIEEEARND